MRLLLVLTLICLTSSIFANMSAIKRPSQKMSSLFVIKDNKLKVVDEKIFYEIDKLNSNAKIKVVYTIKNEGTEVFDEAFYFIYPNTIDKKVSVKVNNETVNFQKASDLDLDKLDVFRVRKQNNKDYRAIREEGGGFIFPIKIKASKTKVVEIQYVQVPGFSKLNSNASFAAMSHYRNMMNTHDANRTYSYYFYPIRSFSKGVDKVFIQFKYPKYDRDKNKVSLINLNTKLKFVKEEADYYIYEGSFKEAILKDILYFELQSDSISNFGFTIAPTAFFIESEDENTWAVFGALDYVINDFQLSVGVLSNFDEKLQFYQEIKFFPPGISHYIAVLFDYRYSIGLVEQVSPNKLFGFRASLGIKFIIPMELSYQSFPPFTKDEWKHELFFNIPFSF